MKLLTKQIEKQLREYPIYSQSEKGDNAHVVCKFFSPIGAFTWYVTEGEKEGNDFRFFGLVINNYNEREYGYFMLSQLEEIKLPYGLGIERDLYFTPCKIGELKH
jgi:hypothetical protein